MSNAGNLREACEAESGSGGALGLCGVLESMCRHARVWDRVCTLQCDFPQLLLRDLHAIPKKEEDRFCTLERTSLIMLGDIFHQLVLLAYFTKYGCFTN